ncbi:Uncharacterized protein dnm_047560 [Desulfonema magnum]|uniref:Uncharacterized protein n=1 Tax=Desulfonema magnum TaxID=45655 RepID=A0A975GPD0_9BACT|nr:Uncharacterized protein dnm_047560 [Desulfonema magnum]
MDFYGKKGEIKQVIQRDKKNSKNSKSCGSVFQIVRKNNLKKCLTSGRSCRLGWRTKPDAAD